MPSIQITYVTLSICVVVFGTGMCYGFIHSKIEGKKKNLPLPEQTQCIRSAVLFWASH